MKHITIIDTHELPQGVAGLTNGHTIWLSPRLTPTGRRCTLAHELVHVERGIPPEGLDAKEEAKVDRICARRLTPPDLLLDALLWTHGDHGAALAHELDLDHPTLHHRLRAVTPAEGKALNKALDDLGQVP